MVSDCSIDRVALTYIMDEHIWPLSLQYYFINTTRVDERKYRDAEIALGDVGEFVSGTCDLEDRNVIYKTTYFIPNLNDYVEFISNYCQLLQL